MAGQGLGWQRTIAVACTVLEHMAEDVLGMTSASVVVEGTLWFDALRGIEGLGRVQCQYLGPFQKSLFFVCRIPM